MEHSVSVVDFFQIGKNGFREEEECVKIKSLGDMEYNDLPSHSEEVVWC